ncbi:MAG: HRDC domain-containing protein [Holophagales bacterium]|nr:HRDC domain-containing protein [Holophagales bacterium]
MKIKFFSVPALDPGDGERELNRFLAQHRVASVERELVADGQASFWAVSVTYLAPERSAPAERRSRIDYREVLSAEDFEVFAALRSERNAIAKRDGVPAYHVFNNAQLAAMVEGRHRNLEQLSSLDGVGPARLAKYGQKFLDLLSQLQAVEQLGDIPGEEGSANEAQPDSPG